MLLPEGETSKTFKTVFCVFFLCIIISPLSDLKIEPFSFNETTIQKENFNENEFIKNSKDFVENELISAVNGILKENNIKAKDISVKTNISENGSIEISNLTLILSDIEDSFEIEKKIFEKTGINPEITVLGDNKNG